VHQKSERLEDGPDAASLETLNAWQDKDGKTQMIEHRRTAVQALDGGEWRLLIDTQLEAPTAAPVTGSVAKMLGSICPDRLRGVRAEMIAPSKQAGR
jgi:hypothetical protein